MTDPKDPPSYDPGKGLSHEDLQRLYNNCTEGTPQDNAWWRDAPERHRYLVESGQEHEPSYNYKPLTYDHYLVKNSDGSESIVVPLLYDHDPTSKLMDTDESLQDNPGGCALVGALLFIGSMILLHWILGLLFPLPS